MDSYMTERMDMRVYVLFLRLRTYVVHKTVKQRRKTRRGGQGEPGNVKSYNWHQGPEVASLRGTMQGK